MSSFYDALWPLQNLQQVFSLFNLSSKCDPNLETQLITEILNAIVLTTFTECGIVNSFNKLTDFYHKNIINIVNLIDQKIKNKTWFCSSIYYNCKYPT